VSKVHYKLIKHYKT